MPSVPRPRSLVPGLLTGRRAAHTPWIPEVNRTSAVVDCAVYRDGCRVDGQPSWETAIDDVERDGGFVWVGLHEPTESQLSALAQRLHLHPLAVEDAVQAHQRPKLEQYDDMVFAVVKTVHYDESLPGGEAEVIETGEIMVFLGKNYVITVRHGEHGSLRDLRHHLQCSPELLTLGPSVVLHAVLDRIVDSYLVVTKALQSDIDEVESDVFAASNRSADSNRMYVLKREVLELRRAAAPLAASLQALRETQLDFVADEVRSYFRDVYDHLSEVIEQVNSFDDLLTTLVTANLAQVSVIQNEDMRKISAWVAIAAVPTMLAGIYGMNFEHMPELHWRFGYPLVLLVMLAICSGLYRMFKRNKWL